MCLSKIQRRKTNMKLQVIKLDGSVSGSIELNDSIFGIEPKTECMADVVRWQLAKRQAGTHAVKGRSDINRTGKKLFRQKGTGRARHGARTSNIFVGGGVVFGPTPRSHGFKVNKKVRALALKTLLSIKIRQKDLVICENLSVDGKTRNLKDTLAKLDMSSALFVDVAVESSFSKACSNLYKIDVLPVAGLNVYDGLSHDKVVLTRSAVESIQERLG